jgi:cyanate lyase
MNRNDITEKIITAKVSKGITWESVAKKVGLSKEWVTAGMKSSASTVRRSKS